MQKRTTAFVIVEVLRTIDDGLGFLRPHAVTGSKKSSDTLEVGSGTIKPKRYLILIRQDVLEGFAKGTYNLLIATKSAEDLDIPKASIVIR